MHAYVITAKPAAWQRLLAAGWAWTVRLAAMSVMVLIGAVTFAVRCTRPAVIYLAEVVMRIEFWAAERTGLPPLGAVVGAQVTAEFMNEFRKGWDRPATETT
ncbi:hypothetical protein DT019_03065 [Streptomyces sp. SDr-06]|uniref:hypothetical protein n=1 Tax=Streptomyces sp. SDr-06 TaxID=2267702 RepID=UPI000DE9B7A8|nr:hypothetical protein [Streptomyces sp. SDr-06]RCH70484.1 hypothetical protein DT019_03065 [Streptomyces sp. SDr-06]